MLNWNTKKTKLFHLQIILLLLLAVSLPFSVEVSVFKGHKLSLPTEPLLLFFAVIVLIDTIQSKGRISALLTAKSWLVYFFVLALIFSTIFSTIKSVSVKFSFVNLLYIFTFFISLKTILKEAPWLFKKMMALYTVGFIFISCLALYRYAQFEWNPVTVKGLFVPFYKDHTIFGATAALLSGYWLCIPVNKSPFKKIFIYRGIGLLLVGAVFLSYSRAAIISMFIIMVFYVIFLLKMKLWQIATLIGIVCVIVLLNGQLLLSVLNQNSFDSGDKQSDLVEHTLSSGNVNSDVSNQERLNRWDAGMQMFMKKPFAGFGPGTYQFAYIPFQRQKMMTRLSVKDSYHIPKNSGGTAHSEYILAASEMGILGIIGWIILIGGLTFIVFSLPSNHPGRKNSTAAFAALSSYFFHAFFNNFLNTDKFALVFWGLIAWMCICTLNHLSDENRFLY